MMSSTGEINIRMGNFHSNADHLHLTGAVVKRPLCVVSLCKDALGRTLTELEKSSVSLPRVVLDRPQNVADVERTINECDAVVFVDHEETLNCCKYDDNTLTNSTILGALMGEFRSSKSTLGVNFIRTAGFDKHQLKRFLERADKRNGTIEMGRRH